MNIICFSHLRWNFVYQRPQHLLSYFSNTNSVFYVEEFIYTEDNDGYLINTISKNIFVIIPKIKKEQDPIIDLNLRLAKLMTIIFDDLVLDKFLFWYYTPMALGYTGNFKPDLIVYDCMDELSAFKFAPPELKKLEQQLFKIADIVFTGGNSLFEAKKNQHKNIYPIPSSIDKTHFGIARQTLTQFADQENIPHPRLGFFGVIDERFDITLIEEAAALKPDWQFVLIGPVVKIDPATLPLRKNIHYLGSKKYDELPVYLSGWDIALIPFAVNESTKFISPTKTPEYLAAGKPVISTPITDVVNPYGNNNLVLIANDATEFIAHAETELLTFDKQDWLCRVDKYLSKISWDDTCRQMNNLIEQTLQAKQYLLSETKNHYVRLYDSRSRTGRISTGRETGDSSQQKNSVAG